jgi:DNA topoisomerase-2
VNGSFGIGSGYSSNVPMFNPLEITNYLIAKLQNKKLKELIPFYRGFKGEIVLDKVGGRYITRGIYDKPNANVIRITELPIGMWNDQYFKKLDKLVDEKKIKDYVKNCTDTIIDIKLILTKENMDEMMDGTNVYKKLSLETYISTENMHLFNAEGKIQKYDNQYQIIDEFFEIRMQHYSKRKIFQLNKLKHDIMIYSNRIKFLKAVMDNTIVINKRSKDVVEKDLIDNKFNMIDDSYNYLLNMSISSFTKEKLQELKEDYDKYKEKYKKLESTTESEMWLADLMELKTKIKI